jgi:hypothetical protein
MFRAAAKKLASLTFFLALVAGGTAGVWFYERRHATEWQIQKLEQEHQRQVQQLESERQKLQEQKKQLQAVVERLSDEKRVAEVLVTDQSPVHGVLRTTLLFVEYARDGTPLPKKTFTIDGNVAHIDAMVIKFDRDFVAQNDPLRGHSIALFRRLFSESQSPEKSFPIDEPGQIPDVYRGAANPADQLAFERELWQNFWRLAEDKDYRTAKGVRVANGQGVWGPFSRDKLYTLTLDADGGLNLTSEPLKGIYREALKPNLTKSE